jgi:dihydropyrimidine dehydrogenase (NAD+) subunit PreA
MTNELTDIAGNPVPAQEAARCLLCHDGPCTAACPKGLDPARFVRSVRFERTHGALEHMMGDDTCDDDTHTTACECECCDAPCEKACIHYDFPIRIRQMRRSVAASERSVPDSRSSNADLSVRFCGVPCENPFFLSSSVVASGYDMCAAAFRAGWAGAVFKTIGFIKPAEVSPRFAAVGKEVTPFVGFRNLEQISDKPLEENLDILKRLKRDFPSKVIVISIMGQDEAEWAELARLATNAGADIIECNFSCPHMTGESLGSDVGQDPELVARYTRAVRMATSVPVLAKMTPNIGHMEIPALAAIRAGADGLAAINTIKSVTGLDLDTLASPPDVGGLSAVSGYSGKAVKPIALRFIHDLAKHPELAGKPLSGMGGIETWRDAVEFIALGCTNLQVTTAVMQYGYRIIDDLVAGLREYLAAHLMSSVAEMAGIALPNLAPADKLDRATISYPAFDKDACVGCGRCHIACSDAGHQAIGWKADRSPHFIAKSCVGCHLCLLVCPHDAIRAGKRVPKPAHLK